MERPSVPRCFLKECRKKTLVSYKCSCDNTFCLTHRMPEDHACGYDFRKNGKGAIEKQNPKVVSDKLIKV